MHRIIILLLFILQACGGYRFNQQDNPFAQYEIKSLSVPMFYNYSNLPEVSADFTRETYRLLTRFSGLKLTSGYSPESDAVFIGIIRSGERVVETISPKNLRVAKSKARVSVGDKRQSFYIPGSNEVELSLQIIVVKKPSEEDLALLKSEIGDKLKPNSKIIFNQKIPLRSLYNREILDDQGTDVIATQNAGVQRRTIKTMATNAAISIRDMILYAF